MTAIYSSIFAICFTFGAVSCICEISARRRDVIWYLFATVVMVLLLVTSLIQILPAARPGSPQFNPHGEALAIETFGVACGYFLVRLAFAQMRKNALAKRVSELP